MYPSSGLVASSSHPTVLLLRSWPPHPSQLPLGLPPAPQLGRAGVLGAPPPVLPGSCCPQLRSCRRYWGRTKSLLLWLCLGPIWEDEEVVRRSSLNAHEFKWMSAYNKRCCEGPRVWAWFSVAGCHGLTCVIEYYQMWSCTKNVLDGVVPNESFQRACRSAQLHACSLMVRKMAISYKLMVILFNILIIIIQGTFQRRRRSTEGKMTLWS